MTTRHNIPIRDLYDLGVNAKLSIDCFLALAYLDNIDIRFTPIGIQPRRHAIQFDSGIPNPMYHDRILVEVPVSVILFHTPYTVSEGHYVYFSPEVWDMIVETIRTNCKPVMLCNVSICSDDCEDVINANRVDQHCEWNYHRGWISHAKHLSTPVTIPKFEKFETYVQNEPLPHYKEIFDRLDPTKQEEILAIEKYIREETERIEREGVPISSSGYIHGDDSDDPPNLSDYYDTDILELNTRGDCFD